MKTTKRFVPEGHETVGPDFAHDNTQMLVDRGCVLFDGSCDCPAPALYNCKRYTDHMKG